MKKLSLHSALQNEYIELPVSFIDRFMPQAPEAALKLYLYLLRAVRDPSILLSVNDMADLFDVTPNQILKAFSYWESYGLLALDMHGSELGGIRMLPIPAESVPEEAHTAPAPVKDAEPAARVPAPQEPAPQDYQEVYAEEAFGNLLKLMECYTGKPVSAVLRSAIADCYLMFGRQTDVMEYLLEYCAEMEKTSPYYIRTVARNWKEDGLDTLEKIRAERTRQKQESSRYARVLKAFGLNRRLISEERAYCDRWEADFSEELILEACRRTVMAIHEPSFQYADSILEGWKGSNVRTLQDVAEYDKLRTAVRQNRNGEENAGREKPAEKAAKRSSFHNMDERKGSYSTLIPSLYER